MPRLENRQLHTIIILIGIVGFIWLAFFGFERLPEIKDYGAAEGLNDFSTDWLCTYDTVDKEMLKKHYSIDDVNSGEKTKIVESANFPQSFSVKTDTVLTLNHVLPESRKKSLYLLVQTKRQDITAFIEDKIVYQSRLQERDLLALHVIQIEPQDGSQVITLQIKPKSGERVEISQMLIGDRNQLMMYMLKHNLKFLICGGIFLVMAICLFAVCLLVKNTWRQKQLLLYTTLEGLLMGVVLMLDGSLFPILTGWNYGIWIVRVCALLMCAMLHILVIRCFIYKKKVLAMLDTGILFYGIFFVCMVVLQALSLASLDVLYVVEKWLFAITVVAYTIALVIAIYDYNRKEGKPALYANGILILSIIIQGIMLFFGKEPGENSIYFLLGFFLYVSFMWILGIKNAMKIVYQEPQRAHTEEEIRLQLVEQFNPNLLFASFHTLQNLIKNGSDKSVKMIYYISVYIRNNLRAMENAGEIIPFENELEHIIAYLQLQKTRNDNLNFAIECKVSEFKIPRNTIEPLIENAVKHGMSMKNKVGNIVFRTYMRADGYAIQIIDDGIGFDTKILKRESPTSLLNLFDQLENLCQAQAEVISKEGKGTVITIILPMIENELMEIDENEIEE